MIKGTGVKLSKKRDRRDFSYHKHAHKFAAVRELPASLNRAVRFIKDQGTTNECTGHAVAVALAYENNRDMSADWQYAKIRQIMGDPRPEGADVFSAVKSGIQFGALPQELAPFSWQDVGPERVANWKNWDSNLDKEAAPFAPYAVFDVDGPKQRDVFDNIRYALVDSPNTPVMAFSYWYSEFNTTKDGIVPETFTHLLGGHAYLFVDFTTIQGTPYLIAQLSSGQEYGHGGLLYFSRSVVNRLFADRANRLKIYAMPDPNQAEQLRRRKMTVIELLIDLMKQLLPFLQQDELKKKR